MFEPHETHSYSFPYDILSLPIFCIFSCSPSYIIPLPILSLSLMPLLVLPTLLTCSLWLISCVPIYITHFFAVSTIHFFSNPCIPCSRPTIVIFTSSNHTYLITLTSSHSHISTTLLLSQPSPFVYILLLFNSVI